MAGASRFRPRRGSAPRSHASSPMKGAKLRPMAGPRILR